jgi:hypothetical protein
MKICLIISLASSVSVSRRCSSLNSILPHFIFCIDCQYYISGDLLNFTLFVFLCGLYLYLSCMFERGTNWPGEKRDDGSTSHYQTVLVNWRQLLAVAGIKVF